MDFNNYAIGAKSLPPSINSSTKDLLLSLMKEQNVNAKLQKELLTFLAAGKSFPYAPRKHVVPNTNNDDKIMQPKTLCLPPRPMQRTRNTMEQLGAYIREQFRPTPSKTRPAEEKERLQNRMAFGKDFDPQLKDYLERKAAESPEFNITSDSKFDEILLEIKERRDFLHDMTILGKRKDYFDEIHYQIKQRLNELVELNKDRARAIINEYES